MKKIAEVRKLTTLFGNTNCYRYLTSRMLAATQADNYFGPDCSMGQQPHIHGQGYGTKENIQSIRLSERVGLCQLGKTNLGHSSSDCGVIGDQGSHLSHIACDSLTENLLRHTARTNLYVPDTATSWYEEQRTSRLPRKPHPSIFAEHCQRLEARGLHPTMQPMLAPTSEQHCFPYTIPPLRYAPHRTFDIKRYKRISPEFQELLKKHYKLMMNTNPYYGLSCCYRHHRQPKRVTSSQLNMHCERVRREKKSPCDSCLRLSSCCSFLQFKKPIIVEKNDLYRPSKIRAQPKLSAGADTPIKKPKRHGRRSSSADKTSSRNRFGKRTEKTMVNDELQLQQQKQQTIQNEVFAERKQPIQKQQHEFIQQKQQQQQQRRKFMQQKSEQPQQRAFLHQKQQQREFMHQKQQPLQKEKFLEQKQPIQNQQHEFKQQKQQLQREFRHQKQQQQQQQQEFMQQNKQQQQQREFMQQNQQQRELMQQKQQQQQQQQREFSHLRQQQQQQQREFSQQKQQLERQFMQQKQQLQQQQKEFIQQQTMKLTLNQKQTLEQCFSTIQPKQQGYIPLEQIWIKPNATEMGISETCIPNISHPLPCKSSRRTYTCDKAPERKRRGHDVECEKFATKNLNIPPGCRRQPHRESNPEEYHGRAPSNDLSREELHEHFIRVHRYHDVKSDAFRLRRAPGSKCCVKFKTPEPYNDKAECSRSALTRLQSKENKHVRTQPSTSCCAKMARKTSNRSLGGSDISEKESKILKKLKKKKKVSMAIESCLWETLPRLGRHLEKSIRTVGGSDDEVDENKNKISTHEYTDEALRVERKRPKSRENAFHCGESIWSNQRRKHGENLKKHIRSRELSSTQSRSGSSSLKSLLRQAKVKLDSLSVRREHYVLEEDQHVHTARRNRTSSCVHRNGLNNVLTTTNISAAEGANFKMRQSKNPGRLPHMTGEELCAKQHKRTLLKFFNRKTFREKESTASTDYERPSTSQKVLKHKRKTGGQCQPQFPFSIHTDSSRSDVTPTKERNGSRHATIKLNSSHKYKIDDRLTGGNAQFDKHPYLPASESMSFHRNSAHPSPWSLEDHRNKRLSSHSIPSERREDDSYTTYHTPASASSSRQETHHSPTPISNQQVRDGSRLSEFLPHSSSRSSPNRFRRQTPGQYLPQCINMQHMSESTNKRVPEYVLGHNHISRGQDDYNSSGRRSSKK